MRSRSLYPSILGAALIVAAGAACTDRSPAPDPSPGGAPTLIAAPAAECAQCHVTHYTEWRTSMHAYAGTDPLWYALNDAGQRDTDGALDQFCVGCHLPAAALAGLTSMPLERSRALGEPLVREGVGCAFCHTIDTFIGISNREATFVHAADRTVYGTIRDPLPTDYHPAEVRSALGASVFCGTCHELRNEAELTIEATYTEWAESAYFSLGIDCQGCHMPEYTGRATPDGPVRTLHRHTFTGVDVALEEVPERPAQIEAAAQLLAGAARLELAAGAGADSVEVVATVTNDRTGHAIPSGPTVERQLWIEILVEDETGAAHFASGSLDANGDLMDHHSEIAPGADTQLALWGSVLLDAAGGETRFMWRATDHRARLIPANESARAAYRFPRPAGVAELAIRARLLFRAVPPHTLRAHGLAGSLPAPPIFTVDEAATTLTLAGPGA